MGRWGRMGRQGEDFTSREYFTVESQSLDSKQSQSPGRHSAPASLPEQLNFTPFVRALQEKHLRCSHRGPGCGHARRVQARAPGLSAWPPLAGRRLRGRGRGHGLAAEVIDALPSAPARASGSRCLRGSGWEPEPGGPSCRLRWEGVCGDPRGWGLSVMEAPRRRSCAKGAFRRRNNNTKMSETKSLPGHKRFKGVTFKDSSSPDSA